MYFYKKNNFLYKKAFFHYLDSLYQNKNKLIKHLISDKKSNKKIKNRSYDR